MRVRIEFSIDVDAKAFRVEHGENFSKSQIKESLTHDAYQSVQAYLERIDCAAKRKLS